MILRLDPRFPLVWRSPDSLQLGVDDPPVTLEGVSIAEERMLAALAIGATRPGLALIGAQSGLDPAQIQRFLSAVRPALERDAPDRAAGLPSASGRVVLAGTGPTVDRLAWRLNEAGLDPRLVGDRPQDAIAAPALRSAPLAVVVTHFVLDPEFYGLWLRRDIPHLPIVYGDTEVRIGPLIEPGRGPCLYCLDRHRTDADPAWPAIASQLWGRRSSAEDPFTASETAAIAARLLVNRLHGEPAPAHEGSAETIHLDPRTGAQVLRVRSRHPECACCGLPGASLIGPAPRGNARERYRRAGPPISTRTGSAASVPA